MARFASVSVELILSMLLLSNIAVAEHFSSISYNKAKYLMKNSVYYDNFNTFYCNAPFNYQNQIELPSEFYVTKYVKRSNRMEWEHVVPVENFGRTFREWREGDPECVNSKGKPYKGRRCANKTNSQFRTMQSDMYNLYPSIGAVNALRSNYNFAELPNDEGYYIKACNFRISGRKVEPDNANKGAIARTYLYFDQEYPNYKMSKQSRKLMEAWNKEYPVTQWECTRAKRIEAIQGNPNIFVKEPCVIQKMY